MGRRSWLRRELGVWFGFVGIFAAGLILISFFRSIGGFSDQSATVTALLFLAVGYLGYVLVRVDRARHDFSPFRVRIEPNWGRLLLDFALVRDNEEGRTIFENVEVESASKYNLLRDGIVLTVLMKRDPMVEPLVYYDTRKCFVSGIGFHETMHDIKFLHDFEFVDALQKERRFWSPDLYIRPELDGYELGIEVWESWWKKTRAANKDLVECQSESLINEFGETTGLVRVPVAILPYDAFSIYGLGSNKYGSKRSKKERKMLLAENGWEEASTLTAWGPIERLEHKYFTVRHESI